MAPLSHRSSPPAADHAMRGRGAPTLEPGLHLLATPIGAADDLTIRGRAALAAADVLACEDTRRLRKLMDLHDVALNGRPVIAYHDHNADHAGGKILAWLADGASVVYASDAGTPLIADPGYRLAQKARAAGAVVRALPGPSAAVTGLVVSGLPTDAFSFIGFPPPKTGPRRAFFSRWAQAPGSLVAFESGRRLGACLLDMADVFGAERPAAIARELTKRHEDVRRGTLRELADAFEVEGPPKGEIVVVIGPRPKVDAPDLETIDALLEAEMARAPWKTAVRTVIEHLGGGRNLVYERALLLKRRRGDGGDDDRSDGEST